MATTPSGSSARPVAVATTRRHSTGRCRATRRWTSHATDTAGSANRSVGSARITVGKPVRLHHPLTAAAAAGLSLTAVKPTAVSPHAHAHGRRTPMAVEADGQQQWGHDQPGHVAQLAGHHARPRLLEQVVVQHQHHQTRRPTPARRAPVVTSPCAPACQQRRSADTTPGR